jgi:hypothetical protein
MKLLSPTHVEVFTRNVYHWIRDTHLRALDRSYKAAIAIQEIEVEYFNGQKIDADATYNPSTAGYFQTKLDRLLRTIRWRLAEFRMASAIALDPEAQTNQEAKPILDKLAVIDRVLVRYAESEISLSDFNHFDESKASSKSSNKNANFSAFTKVMRLNRELKPNTEADVVREFQLSRHRAKKSLQFLALLIIIPILTPQVTKSFIFSPIFSHFHGTKQLEISLNSQLEREAIEKVEAFEKKIKFEISIGKIPHLSSEESEKMVKEKSVQIARESERESSSTMQNILSDLLSVSAFT